MMFGWFRGLVVGLVLSFCGSSLVSTEGVAQTQDERKTSTGKRKSKKKKKKSKTSSDTQIENDSGESSGEPDVVGSADGEETRAGNATLQPKDNLAPASPRQPSPSAWFPPWPTDKFDWILQPIFGFKYTQGVNETTGTTRNSTVEGGVAAGLRGIALVPGNPGFTTGPRIGAAYGYSNSITKGENGKDQSSGFHYRRQWAGLDNAFYFKSIRYSLDVSRGNLSVIEDKNRQIQSFRADNDIGLLLRTWWSVHYSLDHARAYHAKFSSPFLIENDHWLHTRIFTSFMDFVFDFGPGFTDVVAKDFAGETKIGSGTVNYFLLKTQFNPFWKLVGEGVGKYALNASEKRLGLYATERLPEEDLNEPSTLAMPEDSFLGSMFFGVKDLFFGIGVGWRYNIQILNLAKKGDTERETTKNHGIGLYYEVRL